MHLGVLTGTQSDSLEIEHNMMWVFYTVTPGYNELIVTTLCRVFITEQVCPTRPDGIGSTQNRLLCGRFVRRGIFVARYACTCQCTKLLIDWWNPQVSEDDWPPCSPSSPDHILSTNFGPPRGLLFHDNPAAQTHPQQSPPGQSPTIAQPQSCDDVRHSRRHPFSFVHLWMFFFKELNHVFLNSLILYIINCIIKKQVRFGVAWQTYQLNNITGVDHWFCLQNWIKYVWDTSIWQTVVLITSINNGITNIGVAFAFQSCSGVFLNIFRITVSWVCWIVFRKENFWSLTLDKLKKSILTKFCQFYRINGNVGFLNS